MEEHVAHDVRLTAAEIAAVVAELEASARHRPTDWHRTHHAADVRSALSAFRAATILSEA